MAIVVLVLGGSSLSVELVHIGAWPPRTQISSFGFRNYLFRGESYFSHQPSSSWVVA